MTSGAPGRILVVEDNDAEREGIAQLLFLWGYEVKTTEDGVHALQEISSHGYDLVISDLRMPRMNGIELLKALNHQLYWVNCIIIRGEGSRAQEIEAIRFGAFSFLEKPVDAERLKAEVKNCLGNV